MPSVHLIKRVMAIRRKSFLKSLRLMWLGVFLLALLDAAGLYMLACSYQADAVRAEQLRVARLLAAAKPPKPNVPLPPAMINPPAVATVLQSGTLIVISKTSQHMFVFSNGMLWASTPISSGKRRHETPSGVFPILQKHKLHRSNIYSGAPMPFMQRLTWEGIALHAGYVPGYAASHGCVRVPRAFAQSLFKLTNASATTVVIGDYPLETDVQAQQFALTAQLPIRSALAPPVDPPVVDPSLVELAGAIAAQIPTVLMGAAPLPVQPPPAPPPPVPPPTTRATGGQIIQLTAATSQADAEAYWVRLRDQRPDISRFEKSVEIAEVNSHRVYRLRISGTDAHSYCAKLRSAGIGCLTVG